MLKKIFELFIWGLLSLMVITIEVVIIPELTLKSCAIILGIAAGIGLVLRFVGYEPKNNDF